VTKRKVCEEWTRETVRKYDGNTLEFSKREDEI